MNMITLKNINAALTNPSSYTVIAPRLRSGAPSPLVRKMFRIAVKVRMNTSGFTALKITLNDILLIKIIHTVTAARKASVSGLLAKKTVTIKSTAVIIFVLGSSLWIREYPGKNCPSVISEIIFALP